MEIDNISIDNLMHGGPLTKFSMMSEVFSLWKEIAGDLYVERVTLAYERKLYGICGSMESYGMKAVR